MAINSNLLPRRPSDRALFLTAAALFPLFVLIAYFKSYYFRPFFTAKPLASEMVHLHGIVMTLWVVYFSAQIALVRMKNTGLHMTLGFAGILLAALIIVSGLAVAIDVHLVRKSAPPGISPYGFFAIPLVELVLFAGFFSAAIYYRKRPAEHKGLMLLTAINFLPPALGRIPLVPSEFAIFKSFGIPIIFALVSLAWHSWKHRRVNQVFAAATLVLTASYPLQIFLAGNQTFIEFIGSLAL
ncbi:MAG TPA: hypothetical protein VGC97_24835 [Pyrinomonadaceae bacterium]